MLYTIESTGLEVDYELVEGPGIHPQSLDLLSDDEVWDLQERAVERAVQLAVESPDPSSVAIGKGAVLYIGYDAKTTEPVEGQLAVQSYQFYVIGVGGALSVVFFPKARGRNGRLGLQEMLVSVVALALGTGTIYEIPERIELVGFFLRYHLALTSDLPLYKGRLSNVGGKFATTGEPVDFEAHYRAEDVARLTRGRTLSQRVLGMNWVLPVRFIDVAKHAPERANLAALGDLLEVKKLDLPAGYSEDRIDLLKEGDYESNFAPGIRDPEINVRYWLKICEFAKEYAGCKIPPASAGALAVKMCLQTFAAAGHDASKLLGVEAVTRTEWEPLRQRRRTRKQMVPDGERRFHEQFAIECYHGGRNECYLAGPTSIGRWYDYDLKGAYTTGLVSLRPIDYAASYETRRLKDFLGDVMGFAWVEFEFPSKTIYPTLPVRTDSRGLIQPLRGRSYCTAPEIAVSVAIGARIKILRGVIYPWLDDDGGRMFAPFVRLVRELRDKFEQSGQPLFDEYAKLLGNSVYGKTAQALRGSNAFDLATEGSRRIGPSDLSNAPFAAHTTGLIRAVMGEFLNAIPADRQVISCVTDGILCDVPPEALKLAGEVARRFADCLQRVEPASSSAPSIVKVKHEVLQVLSLRTRAQATLAIEPGKKVLLAKGSISPPPDCDDANAYFVDLCLNRKPGQKTMMRPFVSPRDQIVKEIDVTRLKRWVTMNLEYDMKRRPVRPRMVTLSDGRQYLAFDTEPWATVEEAVFAREVFDEWRKTRVLMTLEDFADWEDYYQSVVTLETLRRKKVHYGLQVTRAGSVGILQRIFLRAYVQGEWGLANELPYREVAELLTRCGCPTTVDDVKNGNKGKLTANVVPRTARTKVVFARMKKVFSGLDVAYFFADSSAGKGGA